MTKSSIELAVAVLEAAQAEGQMPKDLQERVAALGGIRSNVKRSLAVKIEERELSPERKVQLLDVLEKRLGQKPKNYKRPDGIDFTEVKKALEANSSLMWSLSKLEESDGKPDIISIEDGCFVFADCSTESPISRRNLNYRESEKMAGEFGVELMNDEYYKIMQEFGKFDRGSRIWLKSLARGWVQTGSRAADGVTTSSRGARYRSIGYGWRGMIRVPKA